MEQEVFDKKIDIIFNPESIAIIGASADPAKPGGTPVSSLVENGFRGNVYPVNPRYEKIGGLKCYPSIEFVPGEVDVAIIAVPANRVVNVLELGNLGCGLAILCVIILMCRLSTALGMILQMAPEKQGPSCGSSRPGRSSNIWSWLCWWQSSSVLL